MLWLMVEGSKSFAGRNISFNAAGALFGLLGRPQPALTGSLNSYHEFVEGGLRFRLNYWIRRTADAAWQVSHVTDAKLAGLDD
jgi:hypothetical protein